MAVRAGALRVALFLSVLSTSPVLSQQEDTWDVRWKEGLKFESSDGHFELQLGGRIQTDFVFAVSQSDGLERDFGRFEDASELRRARLLMAGTLYERVEFKIEYDFAGGDAEAKDVYLGFLDTPAGNIRIGHFKEPFSLETLTSSKHITFVERSLPVVFAPDRNTGVMLHDSSERFTWGAGAFRESDEFAVSTGEDRTSMTGRFVWRPLFESGPRGQRFLHIGLAATSRDSGGLSSELRGGAEVHISSRLAATGQIPVDGLDVLGFEVAGVAGPFWFAGEYVTSSVDTPDRGTLDFDGYYAQAGYFLTGESRGYKTSSGAFDRTRPSADFDGSGGSGAWEVALRYSTTDLSDADVLGGVVDSVSAALNWYPNPVTRLMLNWVHPDLEGSGDADFFLVRAQIEF